MIQISLTTAFLLYGGVIVVGMALIWVLGELRAGRAYRVLEHQFRWRCAFCGYVYLDAPASVVSQCPRCYSYNMAGDAQDRGVSDAKGRMMEHAREEEPESTQELPRRNSARRKRPGQSRRGPRRRR